MEAFLRALLPRLLPADRASRSTRFQGKSDLLGKLEARLAATRSGCRRLADVRLVDRDDEDCRALKQRLEAVAREPAW